MTQPKHRILGAMSNSLRKPQSRLSIGEYFTICGLHRFGLFASCLLEHPCALPLAGVDVFFRVFGEDGFVLVDSACGFAVFGPVDDPIFKRGGVMVEVVVADGGYCRLCQRLRRWFCEAPDGLELHGVRRQAEAVRSQRNSSVQKHRYIGRFHECAHGADAEAFRCQRRNLNRALKDLFSMKPHRQIMSGFKDLSIPLNIYFNPAFFRNIL